MTGVGFLPVWTATMAALLGLGVMSWMWMSAVGATVLLEKVTSVETRPLSAVLAAGAIVWAL